MNKALLKEALQLPLEERIELAQELLDSVGPGADELPPLTPEQMQEIDRRLAEHEKNPSRALSGEEVRTWLWSRRK
jgi:putative addiction module component (TIGR02574 family)